MMVFKIYQEYRDIGVNYGMVVHYVDFGIGASYAPADVAKKLFAEGLKRKDWVTFRGEPISVKGCGLLVQGLKQLGIRVEVEDGGKQKAPGWFSQVDRWLIWWSPTSVFNYGALRPRQELLMYGGDDIPGFLGETEKWDVSRGILVKDREGLKDAVKGKDIRVYKESEYQQYIK